MRLHGTLFPVGRGLVGNVLAFSPSRDLRSQHCFAFGISLLCRGGGRGLTHPRVGGSHAVVASCRTDTWGSSQRGLLFLQGHSKKAVMLGRKMLELSTARIQQGDCKPFCQCVAVLLEGLCLNVVFLFQTSILLSTGRCRVRDRGAGHLTR